MTMLDRMRRHRNWLKWSLALVCLAFVIFYIPDFLRGTGADAASSDTIAVIQGQDIHVDEFRRTYQAQLQAYRAAYGGKMSASLVNPRSSESIVEISWVARSNSSADKTDRTPADPGAISTLFVWSVRLATQISSPPSRAAAIA